MFQQILPIIKERGVVLTAKAGADGRVLLYIAPANVGDEKEALSAVTTAPFCVNATAEELDGQLPAILGEWVASRATTIASLEDALAASQATMQAASAAAKKSAAEKAKKPSTTIVPPAKQLARGAKPGAAPGLMPTTASGDSAAAADDGALAGGDGDDDAPQSGPQTAAPAETPPADIKVPSTADLF
jgi:PRTRC genetic system protein E